MAEGWSADVIAAVDRWASTQRGSASGSASWRRLGPATARPDGWFVLDLRDGGGHADTLSRACFSNENGPERGPAFPVERLRTVDGVVHLQGPDLLPSHSRYVWAQSLSPRFLLDRLSQGLRAAGPAPLADALARNRLAGPPSDRSDAPGLLDAQRDAYRACLSPGVRLVWGPPGTGKTLVLAMAIEQLVRQGKRVLLVSAANVAVDNALRAVVPRLGGQPGTAVRVGPSQLTEIAADPNVQLELLAAQASAAVDRDRQRVADALRDLDERDTVIARLQRDLAGYDEVAFRAAVARIDAEAAITDLRSRIRDAVDAAAVAAARDRAGRAARVDAREAYAAAAEARSALDDLDRLKATLAQLDEDQRTWVAGRARRRKATSAASGFVADATVRRRGLLDRVLRARQLAGATTRADLAVLDDRLDRAEAEVGRAEQAHHEALDLLKTLQGRLHAATEVGPASDADRELVRDAVARRLPELALELHGHRARERADTGRRRTLELEQSALMERSRRLRDGAEKEIVRSARMVATTLARSRVHPAVATESFDVVLVDEAGAATLAEVLLALCRGRTTAVLFGDFLQLGPVLDGSISGDSDRRVRTWVRGTCFSHVGIRAPQDAFANGSCIALTRQFRFGPELRRLANDVVYEVLEDGPAARAGTEIVLVDVSTVPDLADIRAGAIKGRWWTAGVVLSRALAELHVVAGPVGIVTPYKVESEAVLAGLRDGGVVADVSVGTVHAFQGREYGTVVLDLVEAGNSWVASGRRGNPDRESGVRVFGVGITRARHRLYVIVDGEAVGRAVHGPLGAFNAAMKRGDVRRWSAAALLGVDEPPPGPVDTTFTEVAEVLQQLVTITDVHDERSFVDELHSHIGAATERLWMWSPWIANRARDVIPLIGAAVARGVDVRVFLRPDGDRNMGQPYAQDRLAELAASGATIIRSDLEHRKIVVVDGGVVLLGSLNPLSADPGRTREVMLTMRGRAFATRLLTELRAEEIGTPRPCSTCRTPMELRRRGGRAADLFHHCRTCDVKVPFGDQ